MADPTPAELSAAAQKQHDMQEMQQIIARMNLVAQKVDATLRLEVPNPALIVDILTSLLAATSVREHLKTEQIVSSYRNKVTVSRRYEKANAELQAKAPGMEADVLPPTEFDPAAATASLAAVPDETEEASRAPSSIVLTDDRDAE